MRRLDVRSIGIVALGHQRMHFMRAAVTCMLVAGCGSSDLREPDTTQASNFKDPEPPSKSEETDVFLPSQRKRIFYFRNGTLGKIRDSSDTRPALEVADEACTNEASQRGFGGSWKAWLSSSETDAIDRISDVAPWYRVDQETLLFASKAELARGPRVRVDATTEVEDWDACMRFGVCGQTFWSGTAADGRRTSDNCLDWTVYTRPAIATVGRADLAGGAWVASESLLCDAYLALLCIEQ